MPKIITQEDIPACGELKVPRESIVTPVARELAAARGVTIREVAFEELSAIAPPDKTVALGADHGGFQMKEALKPLFAELKLSIRDVGVNDETAVDYPDIAEKVADLIVAGTASRGVIVDGAGIGSAMAANKIPGIRAALCYDKSSARNSREHNDANVLTLGGRLLTLTQAEEVLRTWLTTAFGKGRHVARVEKISRLEQRYLKRSQG